MQRVVNNESVQQNVEEVFNSIDGYYEILGVSFIARDLSHCVEAFRFSDSVYRLIHTVNEGKNKLSPKNDYSHLHNARTRRSTGTRTRNR